MIRMMTEADEPMLAQLFLKGRRQAFHWVDPALFRLEDFAEQTRGEEIWVAEKGGSPCGFVSIWGAESFVHHLYVVADWQRWLSIIAWAGRTPKKRVIATSRGPGAGWC